MSNLNSIIKEAMANRKPADKPYVCKYCEKGFARESTLTSHMCEQKRRAMQKDSPGVRIGFQAWLRFLEITQSQKKDKTYEEFRKNNMYTAFVKFGQYCVDIRAIRVMSYVEWLLKKNKNIDKWATDALYEEFLFNELRVENPKDALERSIRTMGEWAEEKDSLPNHYFKYASPNVVAYHISCGRISPWVLYNCKTGRDMIAKFNEDHLKIVYSYIDPDFWHKEFKRKPDDHKWAKEILEKAGL